MRIWTQTLIPGLLQTAEYARALFLAAQTDTSADVIDALVAARLARQVILDRVDPPDTVVVLDEAVLHRLIGSPQAMHDALVHVAELSRRPYIIVQVVLASNGANAGLSGAFDIASADSMPETLRMEGVEDQITENTHAPVIPGTPHYACQSCDQYGNSPVALSRPARCK